MSQQRITEALSSLFSNNPIVFWHDADGEFSSSVELLKPSEIDLLDLDVTPWLQVKIELERAGEDHEVAHDPDRLLAVEAVAVAVVALEA